jgi:predicted nucleic acid-binding protein
MRQGEVVFVDSGAFIALALNRDPLHAEAEQRLALSRSDGARLATSIPVVIETFTFLDRKANRHVAMQWREALYEPGVATILPCDPSDLEAAWSYFRRPDLHKLSAVDATSFAIMKRHGIRLAFTFDHHFAAVGFAIVG